MKIAIPVNTPDLDARVEHKLGTAPYLLVIDINDMSFEAVEGPPPSHGPGAGIQAVSLVLGMGAKTLLAGNISPNIAGTLRQNGIEIITSVTGIARDAAETYKRGEFSQASSVRQNSVMEGASLRGAKWHDALRKAARQFFGIIPVLAGVILLVGLFHGFMPRNLLLTVFSGNAIQDTLWGACIGSILAGNPVNSYVIGETLLKIGVSLFGVTALMLSWINVGLIQLPVEISAFGVRFALLRNTAAFIMILVISMLTVLFTGFSI